MNLPRFLQSELLLGNDGSKFFFREYFDWLGTGFSNYANFKQFVKIRVIRGLVSWFETSAKLLTSSQAGIFIKF